MAQQVTISGNVSQEPELIFTQGGTALGKFSVACERSWDQNGEKKKETSFFNVVCWGRLAENVCGSVKKGYRVVVEGRLDQRSFETNAGEKRSVVEVTASDVGLSLMWDSGELFRTERSTPAPTRQVADPVYGDDEPF